MVKNLFYSKLYRNVKIPTEQKDKYAFYAYLPEGSVSILPGKFADISTGICCAIPETWRLLVSPSERVLNKGCSSNSMIFASDNREEIVMRIQNNGMEPVTFDNEEFIATALVVQYVETKLCELPHNKLVDLSTRVESLDYMRAEVAVKKYLASRDIKPSVGYEYLVYVLTEFAMDAALNAKYVQKFCTLIQQHFFGDSKDGSCVIFIAIKSALIQAGIQDKPTVFISHAAGEIRDSLNN